ncbi:MAG: hypothetical protein FJ095_15685, partial [Deltaproteobacteria bacterium]|nr:hypothetical protein [Deltaproteobacteria bacterium]
FSSDIQEGIVEQLCRVVTDVRELPHGQFGNPARTFSCRYHGREFRVTVNRPRQGRFGVCFATVLGVPARLHLDGHFAPYANARLVPTGDPEFDQRYTVQCLPVEIGPLVMNERRRRWFVEISRAAVSGIDTDFGSLSIGGVPLRVDRATFLRHIYEPTAEELAFFLDGLLDLATGVERAFPETEAHIASAWGHDAAAAWRASHVRSIAATTEERLRFRKVLFLVLGAAAVVGILVPLVLALIMLLAAR